MSTTTRAAALIAGALLLAGCGGGTVDEPTAAPTTAAPTTTEPTPEPLGTVRSVDDVQAAYIEAGGDCAGELENRNNVRTAVSSGVCPGSGTVLTAYIDHDGAKNAVELLLGLSDRIDMGVVLGENWVINPSGDEKDQIDDFADALGGQVISKTAADS